MSRLLRRWAPPIAVGMLLVVAWLASAFASPQINNLPVPPLQVARSWTPASTPTTTESAAEAQASRTEESTPIETPDERTGLIAVVTIVVIAIVGGVSGWLLVRRRVAAARQDPVVVSRRVRQQARRERGVDVVEAVDAGLAELSDSDADPRRAVIACWVRLEAAAAAAGTPRRAADSPTDLVMRLLQTHSVSPEALDGLAVVYREARYATHVIDERMRQTAAGALRLVRAELGGSAPVAPGRPGGGGRANRVRAGGLPGSASGSGGPA